MNTPRQALVHRLPASAPDDVTALVQAVDRGEIDPRAIVAVLGKTEGNGCVNDFSRGLATQALKHAIARLARRDLDDVARDVAFVMSGGTEGGLSPHWLVFEVRDAPAAPATPAAPPVQASRAGATAAGPATEGVATLAIGVAITPAFLPEEIGRMPQALRTAEAVQAAMRAAGIADARDVHYVQVKCPLLTRARIEQAYGRGRDVATEDTYLSMGYSRGASALGVALALGEVSADALSDARVCRDAGLYSGRASTSAGIELMENQIMVLGNSTAWRSDYIVGHGVMRDALDVDAVDTALASVGLRMGGELRGPGRERVAAVLAKAEPSQTGAIRGRRHTMLDDSDIHASRHARALVGGVLAGVFGETQLFVSGGAEHQGPDGGGPVAVIARRGP
ncbi:cyanuric acid amidohydrolase [Bordetella genomosp. 8]|uniref:Cyanuric acid amidohydrolase n=1 Tax=Bordetella genomosp. 8 TaxID=1416806 RepID=A0A1W6YGY5_9BORD|nr:ring-opening amidohydrolase [Bordetella genomosp. 8]ARP80366.1 cyanuric acid amidohydrolase [Bordetella genomosp. 8]